MDRSPGARGERTRRRRVRGVLTILLVPVVALASLPPASASAGACSFKHGFAALREAIGPSIVGACLEDEHFNAENGNAEQRAVGGLLVWRKSDNWTAFTDGASTWIVGPNGVVKRANAERFPWERDPVTYAPAIRTP